MTTTGWFAFYGSPEHGEGSVAVRAAYLGRNPVPFEYSRLSGEKIENRFQMHDIRDVEWTLEQMAQSLIESGDYRVTSRLEPQAEYHPPDNSPKLVAAVVDVETTGTNPDHDKIIELGICLFEYDRQSGRIYKVLGSWECGSKIQAPRSRLRSRTLSASPMRWSPVTASTMQPSPICLAGSSSSSPTMRISTAASWRDGFPRSPQNIGGVAAPISTGRPRVSAHQRSNSSPISSASFTTGIVPRAIVGPPSMRWRKPLPGTGRLALQALLEQARLPTWPLWARDAAIEKKDVLKARGYAWSPGEFG
jgi:DNA polymerase-3 subunit epsilon